MSFVYCYVVRSLELLLSFFFLLITDYSSCANLIEHSSAYCCFEIEGLTLIVGREAEKS